MNEKRRNFIRSAATAGLGAGLIFREEPKRGMSKKEQLDYKRDLFISEVLDAVEKLYSKECGLTGLPGSFIFGDPTEKGMTFGYELRNKKPGERGHTYLVKAFSEEEVRACVNLVMEVVRKDFQTCPPELMENVEEKLV